MMRTQNDLLLRKALFVNMIFSEVSAVLFLVAGSAIDRFMGTAEPMLYIGLGIGLLVFAGFIFWVRRQEIIKVWQAGAIVVMDLIWVLGSAALLLSPNPLTTGGMWAVALVADIVLVFAIVQFLGIRRMRSGAEQMAAA